MASNLPDAVTIIAHLPFWLTLHVIHGERRSDIARLVETRVVNQRPDFV